ncbi:MAG TPA: nucleotide exchange factor GrpE [Anaerolineae bacterium]
MSETEFEIDETPWPLPPGVEAADPAQRIADDVRRVIRLRELLRDKRSENRSAIRALLLKLLEATDALERILAIMPDPDSPSETRQWNSIRVTRKLLDEALRMQNVTPIELLGRPADPMLCEVDSYQARPDLPDETVVQEVIKGYRWGDEVQPLRSAVVVISRRV